jgi:hypothetical protein
VVRFGRTLFDRQLFSIACSSIILNSLHRTTRTAFQYRSYRSSDGTTRTATSLDVVGWSLTSYSGQMDGNGRCNTVAIGRAGQPPNSTGT